MILSFDIDGVICNLAEEMAFRLRQDGYEATVSDIKTFKIEDTFDVGEDWFDLQADDPTFWLNAKPYEDAWYMINKWFYQGHDVYFVTAREGKYTQLTERWLEMWDIPFNALAHTEIGEKLEILDFLDAELFVEDRMEEANLIAKGGRVSYLVDRPWNQGETPAIRIPCLRTLDDIHINA